MSAARPSGLTVKLRGRVMRQAALTSNEALQVHPVRPDWSRECTIPPSARGDTAELHGPLQRLLDGTLSLTAAALLKLNRRTLHAPVRAVHAAVTG